MSSTVSSRVCLSYYKNMKLCNLPFFVRVVVRLYPIRFQGAIPLFQQYYLNIVYSIMKNVAWQWLDSWPEADCMIGFIIVYILIIPIQAAWAYNKRKRENIISQNQLFFLKLGLLLKRERFYWEKKWCVPLTHPAVIWLYRKIALSDLLYNDISSFIAIILWVYEMPGNE